MSFISRLFRNILPGAATHLQEMPAVTTKGGDSGKSTLYSGEFLPKHDRHFEVIGDIDELSSLFGVARYRIGSGPARLQQEFMQIQQLLHHAMAVIATSKDSDLYSQLPRIEQKHVEWLEKQQAYYAERTMIEPRFVLPGEKAEESAWLDYTRTVTRRCERRIVGFIQAELAIVYDDLYVIQRFFNRLSDYLFVLARHLEMDSAHRSRK